MSEHSTADYENFHEAKPHGDTVFPFNIYPCSIPQMFPEVLIHWHEDMEIIYIKKGSGIVTVDAQSRALSAPSVVFILPGQLHAIRQQEKEQMEYENIIFHPRLLVSAGSELFYREYLLPLLEGMVQIPTFLTPEDTRFTSLTEPLDACDREAGEKGKAYPVFVKSQLFLLCYRLLICCPQAGNPSQRATLDQIKPVLSYVDMHFREKICVADAARQVGFSEAYFMHFFKEITGKTFVSYLNEYRLSRAEMLLRTTKDSVLDIALETGFQNFSYFIRAFKQKYGMTPMKYRSAFQREIWG